MKMPSLIGGQFVLLAIFFPLMKLNASYTLRYGKIGPLNELKTEYPLLDNLLPTLSKNLVNNQPINNPVVAVSSSHPDKLMDEIECITFFSVASDKARADEEILGPKHLIKLYKKDCQIFYDLNGEVAGHLLSLSETKFQYFPQSYYTWDNRLIEAFEAFLCDVLKSNFYNALVSCTVEVSDKEAKRDSTRILVSLKIFNEAFIPPNIISIQLFSKSYLVLLGAAFEALLNLPSDNIDKAFQHSVMLLAGNRSVMLKRFCKEFYNLRSKLAHGEINWYEEEEMFNVGGNESLDYSVIAKHLFIHCLKTKLFLMGLFPEYERDLFQIENYI
jgi:hypothetical protein